MFTQSANSTFLDQNNTDDKKQAWNSFQETVSKMDLKLVILASALIITAMICSNVMLQSFPSLVPLLRSV